MRSKPLRLVHLISLFRQGVDRNEAVFIPLLNIIKDDYQSVILQVLNDA